MEARTQDLKTTQIMVHNDLQLLKYMSQKEGAF